MLVSYAHEDAASTGVVAEEVRARGVLTWQDVQDIRAGKKVQSEIAAGIERSDAVLSLLTPSALASQAVRECEIAPALDRRRRGEPKDLIVVPRNLGTREDIAARTVRIFGADLTLDWMPLLRDGDAALTPREAAPAARAVLGHFYPRDAERTSGTWRIGVHGREFTPGARDLELDWTPIVGGDRRPGTPDDWSRVWAALRDVKHTLAQHSARRTVVVDGQAHLTAGALFGLAFSRTSGFSLTILSGGASWDQSVPASTLAAFELHEEPGALGATHVAVEIELARSVTRRVSDYIARTGRVPRARLLGVSTAPADRWLAPTSAGPLAAGIGRRIADLVDRTGARRVDLFYAGPLTLAILLGAELGSIEADLQLFEFHEGAYQPSLRVPQGER